MSHWSATSTATQEVEKYKRVELAKLRLEGKQILQQQLSLQSSLYEQRVLDLEKKTCGQNCARVISIWAVPTRYWIPKLGYTWKAIRGIEQDNAKEINTSWYWKIKCSLICCRSGIFNARFRHSGVASWLIERHRYPLAWWIIENQCHPKRNFDYDLLGLLLHLLILVNHSLV